MTALRRPSPRPRRPRRPEPRVLTVVVTETVTAVTTPRHLELPRFTARVLPRGEPRSEFRNKGQGQNANI